jgi:hypothetical protein
MRVAYDVNGGAHFVSLNANSVSNLQPGWSVTLTVYDGEEAVFNLPAGSLGTTIMMTHSYAPGLYFITVDIGEVVTFTNISEVSHTVYRESGSYALATFNVGAEPVEPRGRTTGNTAIPAGRRLAVTALAPLNTALVGEPAVFYIPAALVGTAIIIDR